jgi:hypothetical protein
MQHAAASPLYYTPAAVIPHPGFLRDAGSHERAMDFQSETFPRHALLTGCGIS